MGVPYKYWRWVRLNAGGTCSGEELAEAQAFMQQQFPDLTADLPDRLIQQRLMQLWRSETTPVQQQAERCLRCFISNQIEQVCIELEQQFGRAGGFSRQDLFPLVLNDVDRKIFFAAESSAPNYQPLAAKILQDFDPEKSLLSTWTKRNVLYDKQLNAFLEECGIRLTSDWATLNGKRPSRLPHLLAGRLSPAQIQRQGLLLESFHAVYRRDRRQHNRAGQRCQPPTAEQLQQMVQYLQEKGIQTTGENLLQELRALAAMLRSSQQIATESIDEQGADRYGSQEPETDQPDMLLKLYFQEFLNCLSGGMEQTLRDRLTYLRQKRPPKDEAFFMALKLFYCQLRSMTEIAPQIGLQKQFQVSRLLKLEALREDVRRYTIAQMRQQEQLKDRMGDYFNPSRLAKLDQQLDAALDQIIKQAAAEVSSPNRTTHTLFAQRLCQCLDNWRTS